VQRRQLAAATANDQRLITSGRF